jgi:two-component system response regulator CpxR
MATPTEPLLIIDDDRDLCELLGEYLQSEGYAVAAAHDGDAGIEEISAREYSLVVLDVMLPGKRDGYDVLTQIRARADTPVLMLTARGDDIDRIVGLEMGADDYLSKPFNPRELLARIRAVLRRSNGRSREAPPAIPSFRYKVGDVELESGTRTLLRGGEPVELTAVEFSLLEILLRRAGRIVAREELTREVLGRPLSPYDRSIDVHVSKLRKKLGHGSGGGERIKSIRGSGYIYILPSIAGKGSEPAPKNGEA